MCYPVIRRVKLAKEDIRVNAKKARSGNPAKRQATSKYAAKSQAKPFELSDLLPAGLREVKWSSWRPEWLFILISAVLSYLYLVDRLKGVSVSVLIDEYSYVLDSHYRELTEAYYPNHLFQAIYQVTNSCGVGFYDCARSLNAIFVVLSAVVIYLIALHISTNKWLSLLAYLVTIFSTFGTYTAYFMPEALFNFLMLISFYLLFRFGNSGSWVLWLVIGVSFGIASLAKPHTLFVLPAIAVFLFFWPKSEPDAKVWSSFIRPTVVITTVLVSKLALGFLLAGEKGFSLFGSYGGALSTTELTSNTLGSVTWGNLPTTSLGQLIMITIVLGISLPLSVSAVLNIFKYDLDDFYLRRLRILFGLSLVNMMVVVAIFEAWQSLTNWMHTRYYTYLLPLALVMLIEAYVNGKVERRNTIRTITFVVFSIIAVIALTGVVTFGANWIDAPDLLSYNANWSISRIAIFITVVLAIWFIWNYRTASLVAIIFYSVTFVASGNFVSGFLVERFAVFSAQDNLGKILRDYLPQEDLDQTAIVGTNRTDMERVLFFARTGSDLINLAPDTGISVLELIGEPKWLVRLGEVNVTGITDPILIGDGFTLHAITDTSEIKPRNNQITSFADECTLATNTRWSCGPQTTINVNTSIAGKADAYLIFEVATELAGQEFTFTAGDATVFGTLPSGLVALSVPFENTVPINQIAIKLTNLPSDFGESEVRFIRPISANLYPNERN